MSDWKPKRKVAAGGVAGAIVTVIVSVFNLFDLEISGDLAAALTTLIGFIVAYFVPEPAEPLEGIDPEVRA